MSSYTIKGIIVRAPVVVKVPVTLGNVEKSYAAVMVTGMGVEADAEGTEPIVKKAITPSAIAAISGRLVVFFIFVFYLLGLHLSFQLNLEIALKQCLSPERFRG